MGVPNQKINKPAEQLGFTNFLKEHGGSEEEAGRIARCCRELGDSLNERLARFRCCKTE
jgi:hypothetical protein